MNEINSKWIKNNRHHLNWPSEPKPYHEINAIENLIPEWFYWQAQGIFLWLYLTLPLQIMAKYTFAHPVGPKSHFGQLQFVLSRFCLSHFALDAYAHLIVAHLTSCQISRWTISLWSSDPSAQDILMLRTNNHFQKFLAKVFIGQIRWTKISWTKVRFVPNRPKW